MLIALEAGGEGGIILLLFPQLSRIRLSSALQSLLWTSKVPKKSNMSNKPGFPCWVYQDATRFQSA